MSSQTARLAPVTSREVIRTVLLLGTATVLALGAGHALPLFSKHFWNDEWVTHLIAADPDPARAARALWSAIDNNTPTLFLLLRALGIVAGSSSETVYHAFAFSTIFLGVLGIYLALRQTFVPLVSLTAALAVWAHPLILRYSFDARYYGPLFCAAVWFAYLLGRTAQPGANRARNAAAAIAGILLCTMHYFGVICLALVVSAEMLRRRRLGTMRNAILVALPGVLSLAAFLPLLLSQRRSLPVGSYLPRPSTRLVWDYASELLLPQHLAVLGVVAAVACVSAALWPAPHERDAVDDPDRLESVAGLASLTLLPVVLLVFSFSIQGAMFVRYALPALAGLAAGIALLVSRFTRTWLVVLCLFFAATATRTLRHMADENRFEAQETQALVDVIRRDTGSAPVTFEIYMPYQIAYYAPDLKDRVFVLGGDTPFFQSEEVNTPDYSTGVAATLWERDWAQRYESLYGTPGVMSWARLKQLPRRFLIVGSEPVFKFDPSLTTYPGFVLHHVERSLYELKPAE